LCGGTSEYVTQWLPHGGFGLWDETTSFNDVLRDGYDNSEGLGETVGRHIANYEYPHAELSVAAAAYEARVPLTSHLTIGADITHMYGNCRGEVLGELSYRDFLIFAEAVSHLEGGVFLNVGTAVTGPEVYLKALSMSRNVARQSQQEIRKFTTAVFDMVKLPVDWQQGEASSNDPAYYFRPWKTILLRTVADGGQSYYVQGDHRDTIPSLWAHFSLTDVCV